MTPASNFADYPQVEIAGFSLERAFRPMKGEPECCYLAGASEAGFNQVLLPPFFSVLPSAGIQSQ